MSGLAGWARDLLRCPACRAELRDVAGPALTCVGCGLTYPVRAGVPVLLVHEATPAADATRD